MRRLVFVLILLGLAWLFQPTVQAEYRTTEASATTTSQTVHVNTPDLEVINDGSDTVYVRVFEAGDAPAAATNSCATCIQIKNGDSFSFADVTSISIIADSGTATVRLVYK